MNHAEMNGHAASFWREVEALAKKMTEERMTKHREEAEVWLSARIPTLITEVARLMSMEMWDHERIKLFQLEVKGRLSESDCMKIEVFEQYFKVTFESRSRSDVPYYDAIGYQTTHFSVSFGDFKKLFEKPGPAQASAKKRRSKMTAPGATE